MVSLALALVGPWPAAGVDLRLSDREIKARIIEESIAGFPGVCPCPYSTTEAGVMCGPASAYGARAADAPLCFPVDVGERQVQDYRRRHGL
jgi:hypothetical protein